MKVAVLVHNDVVRDARVRKQVGTLVAAGHDVHVFGLTQQMSETTYPPTVEGAKLELIDYSHLMSKSRVCRLLPLLREIANTVLVACILSGVVYLTYYGNVAHYAYATLAAVVLALLVFDRLAPRLLSLAGTGILATGLLAMDHLSAPAFVGIGMLAWFLFRYNINFAGAERFARKMARSILQRLMPHAKETRLKTLAKLLAERVVAKEFDAVHSHDIIALIAAGEIKRAKPHVRLIWDAHEIYEDLAYAGEEEGKLMRKFISTNQKYVDGFVTISESFVQFYRRSYALPPARIVMNATRYTGQPVADGSLRAAAGLDGTRKIILFQGGLSPKRGMTQLIEAARELPQPWSIVAMGWGRMEGELRAVADELAAQTPQGKRPLVVIPPAPQEELKLWSAGAHIGIIPYENAGLNHLYCTPNKLWEFPNAGVPILATRLVEMERMISEWGTGFLLPRKFTGRDIVTFLENLDEQTLQEKKANCAKFSKEMSWEKFEPALLELYREMEDAKTRSGQTAQAV